MNEQPLVPTIDGILSGLVVEGQGYEFKALLNLDDQRGKSNFIDDVVAFLNAGPGHLIVGVHEKRGSSRASSQWRVIAMPYNAASLQSFRTT
ncbi:ATPase/AAA domain-containing protein (plasmid) [Rhizobium sp. NXC14]|uniref:RNA-binding domain-containing protein n=1 Tax=Rhizobium sp. NXC14 TaxID=1981173 RepID=UPI000A207574|nr:RNA-binding domain-containing protein [Rhizobium sp. NXC14]ARO32451.1 ATPase/AAA domain-containing protein [Rhizobium sp. NXC14]